MNYGIFNTYNIVYYINIATPTRHPTRLPTLNPTKPPTKQPTASPTPLWLGGTHQVRQGGTNAVTSGVSRTFSGLTAHQMYVLTVKVYATDYDSSSEYINRIAANGVALSSYCNPASQCGSSYFTCLHEVDVTSLVSSSGQLTVLTTATSEVNYCAYNGYNLYVEYEVRGQLAPTGINQQLPSYISFNTNIPDYIIMRVS